MMPLLIRGIKSRKRVKRKCCKKWTSYSQKYQQCENQCRMMNQRKTARSTLKIPIILFVLLYERAEVKISQTRNSSPKKSILVLSKEYSSRKVYIELFERQWQHTESRSSSSTLKKTREEEVEDRSTRLRRSKD